MAQTSFLADANARFRLAVNDLTGIQLHHTKVHLVEQRLRRRVVAMGFASTEDYLQALIVGDLGQEELDRALDLITTNTTSFFRERDHFDFLRQTALPDLVEQRNQSRPRLKFWSAASSDGPEAYTLAMVLAEAQRDGLAFDWAILGTDISGRVLDRARLGIYDADQITGIDSQMRQRYFMLPAQASEKGRVRIVPELRARVRFARLNLIEDRYAVDHDIDVIFLRNVLIYFNDSDRASVLARLRAHLRPGGYLFVGHSEGMTVRLDGLERIRPTVFRKSG